MPAKMQDPESFLSTGRFSLYNAVPARNCDLITAERWSMNGMNYHHTLSSWLNRFDASLPYLKTFDYGIEFATFLRIWHFYLLLLGTIFATSDSKFDDNSHYLMVKA